MINSDVFKNLLIYSKFKGGAHAAGSERVLRNNLMFFYCLPQHKYHKSSIKKLSISCTFESTGV